MEYSPWNHWVYKARSEDETRPYLLRAWVQKGWLIGTDGHRIHMLKVDEEEEFLIDRPAYFDEHEGLTIKDVPDIFKFFPLHKPSDLRAVNFKDLRDATREDGIPALKIGAHEIQAKYMIDAFGPSEVMYYLPDDDWNNPLFMRSEDGKRQVFLMALRRYINE
jgi:hypothetical protein